MEKKYDVLLNFVNAELSCSAHDLEHTLRVIRIAEQISKDIEVDLDVLIPAAILHDIARAKADEDRTIDHANLGSEMAREILKDIGYDQVKIEGICHCIETHSYRNKKEPKTMEAKILFDADKIDGLGATGIARSFAMVGKYGDSIYIDKSKKVESETGIKHPPNIEYKIKYKLLQEHLYTVEGRKIAKERIAFMECYFKQLDTEINYAL